MDRVELAWRGRAAGRIAVDRARCTVAAPRWDRRALADAFSRTPDLADARAALSSERWQDAHQAICAAVSAAPARFAVAPAMRAVVGDRIRAAFPSSVETAASAADRIVAGHYDLLGYNGLRFGKGHAIDWHLDPVHDRRPPKVFWSRIPFLSPESGDHKIIWELNRHQYWLTLGRAFWLTGDTRYRDVAISQLASWMEANPPLIGMNWASMLELAFRSISWIWTLNFFADGGDTATNVPWSVDLLLGLDRQMEQIERNLSSYFSPNTHLLGEALALYVGGLAVPFLRHANRRTSTGRRILIAEIGRQITPDGGHSERSTHYHRYALDFYLLALVVARISGDPAACAFEDAVTRLAQAARLLADDGGTLPHFGDDDGGAAFRIAGRALDDVTDSLEAAAALVGRPDIRIGPPTEEASWLLAHPMFTPALDAVRAGRPAPGPASAALPDTGYYVSRSEGAHIVIDAGPHGFLNAGHAHADALSMTLSLRGTPLLIDPGTYCYTIDAAFRNRMRSTAMHNTLMLDERPAAVPGGPFQWRQSAPAQVRRWQANARFDYLDAIHDGYSPLQHRRRVLSIHNDLVVVADLVSGTGVRRADVHWHLDSRWAVALGCHGAKATMGCEEAELVAPIGSVERFTSDRTNGLGWQAPVYGRIEPATTLRITRTARAPFWIVSVFGLKKENAIEHVEVLPVWSAAGVLEHSLAVRVTRSSTVDCVVIGEARDRAQGAMWRAAGVETDAALVLCRTFLSGDVTVAEVGMVDGRRARGTGRPPFSIELPERTAQTYVDSHTLSNIDIGGPHVRDRGIR
jgi:hypothetical protein